MLNLWNRFLLMAMLVLISGGPAARAATDQLLRISADGRNPGNLSLVLDSNDQIRGLQISGLEERGEAAGAPHFISYDSLASGRPLFQTRGYTVMEIEMGAGFNRAAGGPVTLTYYTNVLTGSRRRVNMTVVRETNGSFSLKREGETVAAAAIEVGNFGIQTIAWATESAQDDLGDVDTMPRHFNLDGFEDSISRHGTAVAAVTQRVQKPSESASDAPGLIPPVGAPSSQSAGQAAI